MPYWIIGKDGATYGPADLPTLRRWVTEHRIVATTPVAEAEAGPWRDASLVAELASAFGAESADPHSGAVPPAPPASPPTAPVAAMPIGDWPPTGVAVPQLVSGIFNLIAGVGWLFTCFGVVLTVPLVILGIQELRSYAKATSTPPSRYVESSRTKAVLAICTVLAGNVASAICGIIILTQLPSNDDPRLRG
jgi:hypothetical protein